MLELIFIYFLCSNICDEARKRRRKAWEWGLLMAIIYLTCEAVGTGVAVIALKKTAPVHTQTVYSFGDTEHKHPLTQTFIGAPNYKFTAVGTYLIGIPLAIGAYFILRSKIRRLPEGDEGPAPYKVPPPSGPQISFVCSRCGASLTAFASQRGQILPCSECKKPIKV